MNTGMFERNALSELLKKLDDTCLGHNLTHKERFGVYPVTITISTDGSMDGQIGMLDNPAGVNTLGDSLTLVFEDATMYHKPGKTGGLSLDDELLKEICGLAKKIYSAYLQVYYIDSLQQVYYIDSLQRDQLQRELEEALTESAQDADLQAMSDNFDTGIEDLARGETE